MTKYNHNTAEPFEFLINSRDLEQPILDALAISLQAHKINRKSTWYNGISCYINCYGLMLKMINILSQDITPFLSHIQAMYDNVNKDADNEFIDSAKSRYLARNRNISYLMSLSTAKFKELKHASKRQHVRLITEAFYSYDSYLRDLNFIEEKTEYFDSKLETLKAELHGFSDFSLIYRSVVRGYGIYQKPDSNRTLIINEDNSSHTETLISNHDLTSIIERNRLDESAILLEILGQK